jgi:3-oxoacyl-[acyl-carrier-protein] synthase II
VKDFDPRDYMDGKEARRMARFSQFAVAAARTALEDASLTIGNGDAGEVGVFLGTGIGGLGTLEQECRTMVAKGGARINPFFIPTMLPNMAAAQVSRLLGIKGYTSTTITACAAGTQAIGEAAEVIRQGKVQVMLAGGTEATICELGLAGFCIMRALTTRNEEPTQASRPFDAGRDGFLPGEGSGMLVLESLPRALRRGARIYAEIVGYGCSSDAYHVVMPDPEGEGAQRAMVAALADARVRPEEIDYINAHGTSTPLNDCTETKAIKRVFGEHAYQVPVSATKSMIGHLLGAGGAVEAIACIMSLRTGLVHPTINLDEPDPECDLDYVPNVARPVDVRLALSNSFGFGGQNACLVLARYEL